MREKTYNNADSFAMAFDDEWQKVECDNEIEKIEKIIKSLSDHPFVRENPVLAKQIANFRIKSLGKFK
tara:strand:+ start:165 stop:368 length:204 start_codon:yes stop_codon:yes gene_type:complete